MTRLTRYCAPVLMIFALSFGALYAQKTLFKIQSTWKLGGDGSWDYLVNDEGAHLLYIARLDRVMVVDTVTGTLVGEIAGLEHAHGIAFDADSKIGYISDGGSGKVLVFDRFSQKIIASIPAGKNPGSILFEPTNHHVITFNGASNDATVIDAVSRRVLTTIPMPGKPEFSVTDNAGSIFVNIEDKSEILRIDATSLKVTASWPLAPCDAPSGLAIDIAHHRLFSVCDNSKMAVVDSNSGKVVNTLPIGDGADAVAYDPAHAFVFSSNGESGTMSIFHQDTPDAYTLQQTLVTKLGARTIAVSPSIGVVYTVSAKLGPKPAAIKTAPKPKAPILSNSFVALEIAR